jgi:hypothetical protein
MKGRIAAIVMSALLVLYLVLVLQLAVRLIAVDNGISKTLGIALLVLPLIGAWALVAEILFGVRTQRLVRELDAAGELPVYSLPKRTSVPPRTPSSPGTRQRSKPTPAVGRPGSGSDSPTTRAGIAAVPADRSGALSPWSAPHAERSTR